MQSDGWVIVRVLTGHPFRVAESIVRMGIWAYCPRYVVRRRHRWDRRLTFETTKPLFPGYLFAAEPFDVLSINRSPIKAQIMARDGHYLQVTPTEIERVRDAETEATNQSSIRVEGELKRAPNPWRIEKLVKAMEAVGARPGQSVNLGDLQRKVAS